MLFRSKGRVIRPMDVIGEMKSTYGMEILYSKAWKVKEYAQNLVYGHPLDFFQMLPSYFYMLEQQNPRTVTKLKVDSENRFEICFMAFGACIFYFCMYCRSTILIDGTHLKGKYKGILFIATMIDGSDKIFLIAFEVGHLENDRCWT